MTKNYYEAGTIIWYDFEFDHDEKGTTHPAIVLQDQGDVVAVLSGSSNMADQRSWVRSESFTYFEVSPGDVIGEKNSISHTTYFKLDRVRGATKSKISKKMGQLNDDCLHRLQRRCAIRSWSSANSIGDKRPEKSSLICWMEENDPERRAYLELSELKFAVVLGRMKSGRLKILSEQIRKNDGKNSICLKEDLHLDDVQEITFQSKPSYLAPKDVCFIVGRLSETHQSRLEELPHLRVKEADGGLLSNGSEFQIGDIVSTEKSVETPLMVVAFSSTGVPITVRGECLNTKHPKFVPRRFTIGGFSPKYHFPLTSKPKLTPGGNLALMLQKSNLTSEELEFLSMEPSIRILNTEQTFNSHDSIGIGSIVNFRDDNEEWDSIRVPWLIVGEVEGLFYAVRGKKATHQEQKRAIHIHIKSRENRLIFRLSDVPRVVNKHKFLLFCMNLPEKRLQEVYNSPLAIALRSP